MSKDKMFWMQGKEYRDSLWDRRNGYTTMSENALMEIAVNLHEIAKQLAELNGKKPPKKENQSND